MSRFCYGATVRKCLVNQTRINAGGQEWNRTTDTRIFNPLLYRLSYLAIAFGVYFLKMTRSKERAFNRTRAVKSMKQAPHSGG